LVRLGRLSGWPEAGSARPIAAPFARHGNRPQEARRRLPFADRTNGHDDAAGRWKNPGLLGEQWENGGWIKPAAPRHHRLVAGGRDRHRRRQPHALEKTGGLHRRASANLLMGSGLQRWSLRSVFLHAGIGSARGKTSESGRWRLGFVALRHPGVQQRIASCQNRGTNENAQKAERDQATDNPGEDEEQWQMGTLTDQHRA
jgi:hypothetical protein